jgi:hypothetical protein
MWHLKIESIIRLSPLGIVFHPTKDTKDEDECQYPSIDTKKGMVFQ